MLVSTSYWEIQENPTMHAQSHTRSAIFRYVWFIWWDTTTCNVISMHAIRSWTWSWPLCSSRILFPLSFLVLMDWLHTKRLICTSFQPTSSFVSVCIHHACVSFVSWYWTKFVSQCVLCDSMVCRDPYLSSQTTMFDQQHNQHCTTNTWVLVYRKATFWIQWLWYYGYPAISSIRRIHALHQIRIGSCPDDQPAKLCKQHKLPAQSTIIHCNLGY